MNSWQYGDQEIYKLLTIKRDAQLPCGLKCYINTHPWRGQRIDVNQWKYKSDPLSGQGYYRDETYRWLGKANV